MRRISVLHIAHQPQTGVWSVITRLARWQIQQGYRVAIGVLHSDSWPSEYRSQLDGLRKEDISVFTAESPNLFGTAAFFYHRLGNPIRRWSRSFAQPDDQNVLHFHNAWLSGALVPDQKTGEAAVATFHGVAAAHLLRRQPLRRLIHSAWARRLERQRVQLTSVDSANTFVAEELFGLNAKQFTIIPNGTDAVPDALAQRPWLHQSPEIFTVGHVGCVDAGKGWSITASAVERLHRTGRPVRLLIAGDGPEANDAKRWCEARPNFAEFLGFRRSPIQDVFPRIDALSIPSISEGLPMAILESLASGAPVIATSVGGIPDAIEDEVNGLLVSRSEISVGEAIIRLMEDKDLFTSLCKQARETHRSKFTTSAAGEAYQALYLA